MPARPKIYIPLLILCIISLFWFLGAAPFNTRGEPREAVVAMSMLQDGNWILPVNNGDEIAFKPPMLHWLVAAFSWLLGGISEFTSRLPSALGATGIVLATYGFQPITCQRQNCGSYFFNITKHQCRPSYW
jgi:4-amino-4-deoxy-L-arabinose transferase-like glycosyltransferase